MSSSDYSASAHPLIRPGASVRVRVPATSANVGPGFDSLGVAVDLWDELELTIGLGPDVLDIDIEGEGAESVRRDDHHLVIRSMRTLLVPAGVADPIVQALGGIRLRCVNRIPHGRGLGSSAAAIGAGVLLARAVLADASHWSDAAVLDLMTAAEGHPDNAAAVMYGGFTVAWMNPGLGVGTGLSGAVSLPVHPLLRAVVAIPAEELATERARAILPTAVPHADAAFNASRSALLVHAITADPSLLLEATQDRIHQQQRASAMPDSVALMDALRAQGLAATISGAGPTVLTMGTEPDLEVSVQKCAATLGSQWRILTLPVAATGAEVSVLA